MYMPSLQSNLMIGSQKIDLNEGATDISFEIDCIILGSISNKMITECNTLPCSNKSYSKALKKKG